MFAPDKVQLAEETTEDAARYTYQNEDQVVHRLVLGAVPGLKENKFACAGGVELLEDNSCGQTAEKRSPEDLAGEVRADLKFINNEQREVSESCHTSS